MHEDGAAGKAFGMRGRSFAPRQTIQTAERVERRVAQDDKKGTGHERPAPRAPAIRSACDPRCQSPGIATNSSLAYGNTEGASRRLSVFAPTTPIRRNAGEKPSSSTGPAWKAR